MHSKFNSLLALIPLLLACQQVSADDVTIPDAQRMEMLRVLDNAENPAVSELSSSERAILKATLALESGEPNQALSFLNDQVDRQDPLVAMLEAEAHRRSAVQAVARAGDYAHQIDDQKKQLEQANLTSGIKEADVRLNSFMDRLQGMTHFPSDVLKLAPDIHSVFLVDKKRSRLFVYEQDESGKLQKVADEYVVTGAAAGDKQSKGDERTPNGIYRFVDKLTDEKLEARYGPVAFPIDYPNALDRLHGKSGSGIWMHGYAQNVGRRPPRDTKGCFALPNEILLEMEKHVQLGNSWVVIGDSLNFDVPDQQSSTLQSVEQTIQGWSDDWSQLKTENYLSYYHPKFRSGDKDLKAWKSYKRRVNSSKSFIQVKLSNLTLIHDPSRWSEGEVVVAEFDQLYASNNYQDTSRKRLYLTRSSPADEWKILIEENVEL